VERPPKQLRGEDTTDTVREGHGVAFRWDKSFKGFGEEAAVNEEAPLGRADTSGLPWRALARRALIRCGK
jgi:hypothetical protein